MNNLKQMNLFSQDEIRPISSWFSQALHVLDITEASGWPDHFGDRLSRWYTMNRQRSIRVLSLFSGAGGLDIGFHDAGFEIVECNEIEPAFANTLIANSKKDLRLHNTNIVCQDIREYDPLIENIDFIIGGPPCQTFSAAGARAAGVNGIDDERGNLFKEYVRILKKLQPRGFLFENVYRIVGAQGGRAWEQVQAAFQEIGYNLHWRILDAADYGVPQCRERLIIVGLKSGSYQFPYPSHGPDSQDQRLYYTAGTAISDIETTMSDATIGGRHGYLLKDIPPGLNYSFYTEKLGHPKPIFGWRSKFSDYLYKADPDMPVRTIKAQGGQYTGPFHWESRRFTTDEYKRLQTFPDDYFIVGNRQKVIHQLGNSVPPQLARILALSIQQQVFKGQTPFTIDSMPETYELGFRKRKSSLTKVYAAKARAAIAQLPHHTDLASYTGQGCEHIVLSGNLELLIVSDADKAEFTLKHTAHDGNWQIELMENNQDAYPLSYQLAIASIHPSELKTITMQSSSQQPKSFLALWKYLERMVREYYHKDDLVQLFGYYQSQQNYSINLEIYDHILLQTAGWQVLSKMSQQNGIGKVIAIDELAALYNLTPQIMQEGLRELKKIGFEIRNHNTNRQITEGMVLIPYAFPSLNERSLQRFTEL